MKKNYLFSYVERSEDDFDDQVVYALVDVDEKFKQLCREFRELQDHLSNKHQLTVEIKVNWTNFTFFADESDLLAYVPYDHSGNAEWVSIPEEEVKNFAQPEEELCAYSVLFEEHSVCFKAYSENSGVEYFFWIPYNTILQS